MTNRWHIFPNLDSLQKTCVEEILQCAQETISAKGVFRLVLAGGNTPLKIYEQLRFEQARWSNWEIYIGDERCLPPDHEARNSKMAQDAWLSHVGIPKKNIHFIPAELGPVEGAEFYAKLLEDVPEFDLVLLGLGEDGHTASLFPGKDWHGKTAIAVFGSPKPPPERISLSAERLSKARKVIFLVGGKSKLSAVRDWKAGKPIPASAISPPSGADIYLDFDPEG